MSNWKRRSINKAYLARLRKHVGTAQFGLYQAYTIYRIYHWTSWRHYTPENKPTKMDNWGEMSARNTLSAAVQYGELNRVARGVYQFAN